MSKRRGSIFYVVMIVLSVLAGIAGTLIDMSIDEGHATQLAYRSEIALSIGESFVDEFFHNVDKTMNSGGSGPIGGIYDKLREESSIGTEIELESKDYISKYLVPNSKQLCESFQNKCSAVVIAKIKDIKPLNINPRARDTQIPKPGIKVDKVEKDAVLEVLVEVIYEGYTKKLAVTRSLKVVNTTIAPLSVFTLFVNDPGFPLQSYWSSKLGMDYSDDRKEQKSVVLDHSWDYVFNKSDYDKEELTAGFDTTIMQGEVPPGRVFMNSSIVPLTNGNRESGMLQNAFFSAESELLPPFFPMDLEQKDEFLTRVGSSMSEEEKLILEEVLPASGKVFTRPVGYGYEVRARDDYEVNGKKRSGYLRYMEAFESSWDGEVSRKNPSKSGLDLFGRVEYKPGVLGSEDEESGWFGKIAKAASDAYDGLVRSFVNDTYNLRISPTLVYGNVLASYFRVMDYKYTRMDELKEVWKSRKGRENSNKSWWASVWDGISDLGSDVLKTVKVGFLGPGQYPIPELPVGFFDDIPQEKLKEPFGESDRARFKAVGWSDDTFEDFLDLPAGMRSPIFFKFFEKMRKHSLQYFGKDFESKIPKGATLAPYNNSIMNYLRISENDSPFYKFMLDPEKGIPKVSQTGLTVLDNPLDQKMDQEWGGEYVSPLKGLLDDNVPLKSFNPFLYYRKATDYISSIYDFRGGKKGEGVNVIRKKYFNEKEGILDINGVIYITGTARPLRFSELVADGKKYVKYKGKSIIITFGEVIFDVGVRKTTTTDTSNVKPQWGKDAPLLTVVALGGIQFETNDLVEATLYSFMNPPTSTRHFTLHGTLGSSELDLARSKVGGVVKFDPSYSMSKLSSSERKDYYWVALTDEIKKYSWKATW